MSNKFFCLYCDPDPFGKHADTCILGKDLKEQKKEKVLNDYGELLKNLGKITGRNIDSAVNEQIEELKKSAR